MLTSAIKDLLKKWDAVRAMVLEWHPNQADFSRSLNVKCDSLTFEYRVDTIPEWSWWLTLGQLCGVASSSPGAIEDLPSNGTNAQRSPVDPAW
ncbi:hypothetical protein TNCV_4056981 [Trichonephila clavipes]|nr:hypothetical protein TNCV_4056981 [Trichonephila clavipes]